MKRREKNKMRLTENVIRKMNVLNNVFLKLNGNYAKISKSDKNRNLIKIKLKDFNDVK